MNMSTKHWHEAGREQDEEIVGTRRQLDSEARARTVCRALCECGPERHEDGLEGAQSEVIRAI